MRSSISKGDYSLEYNPGTQKSYVIEPIGGELNYKIATKNPLKFYDQVFNQDIQKHTVAKDKEEIKKREEEAAREGSPKKKGGKVPVTVKTKMTKRPHMKIMIKLH